MKKLLEELTFEDLSAIYEAHNTENDCDCEECREYRRQWKIEYGYEDE